MQAIQTKYLGATNNRGSRIKATAGAGSVTIPYPHELSDHAVHRVAAQALADKFGWKGELLGGTLPNGDHAFVFNHVLSKE